MAGSAPRAPSLARLADLLRDRVLLGVAGAAVLLDAWLASAAADEAVRIAVFWLVQPLLDVLLVVGCRRACAVPGIDASVRRFWRWLGRAGVLFALGDTAQAVVAWRHPGRSAVEGGALQALPVAAGVGLMVVVVLTHPIGGSRAERVRLWLDAATVMSGAGVFVWYLNSRAGTVSPSLVLLSTIALVTVFGLARVALSPHPPFTKAATVVGITGVASFGLVTALLPTPPVDGPLGPWLVVRLAPSILVAVTPRVQELQARSDPTRFGRARGRPYSLQPYVAVVSAQGFLMWVAVQHHFSADAWGVIVGVALTALLVVVRQLAAFQDNATLLGRLDASMRELEDQERRFRSLVQHTTDVTLVVDRDGRVGYVSPALDLVLGISPDDAVGRPLGAVIDAADSAEGAAFWAELTASDGASRTWTVQARHADGSARWLDVIATNLLGEPAVRGVVFNARDSTEARELHERLHHEATHDGLTALLNRAAFETALDSVRREAARGHRVAVLMIDLDDFKPVNDRYGHHAGDTVLVEAAIRMRGCVRGEDAVARLGGDEFAVLMDGADVATAVDVAQRVIEALQRPVLLGDVELRVDASIGISVGAAGQVDQLLREADAALYAAKRSGKGIWRIAQDEEAPARPPQPVG